MARKPAPVATGTRASIRCAIYTRKSSEEGLDQDFNSLDAQREACAAFVLSQRHEGWVLVPDYYDDGGISGGHMNRPGLIRLLDDVQSGKVDVIIVYKVDRLTRSLSDFARIVEVLDTAGASFVSITQSFNTTTSMGRLTLNVLLSFAQFEREVTGERIRDKIAASKAKGMWMGGIVPYGYRVEDRKLLADPAEAALVPHIMQLYLELGSVQALVDALAAQGHHTRQHLSRDGRIRGGGPFTRGGLYTLLSNPIYRGVIMHKGQTYAGVHEAIIDPALWEAVQHMLADNRVSRRHATNADQPSLLAGMIRDHHNRPLSPRHARKGSLRYRYYVSRDTGPQSATTPPTTRIAAGPVETAVATALHRLCNDPAHLLQHLCHDSSQVHQLDQAMQAAQMMAARIPTMAPSPLRAMLLDLDLRLATDGKTGTACVLATALAQLLDIQHDRQDDRRIVLELPALAIQRGHEQRLTIASTDNGPVVTRDARLVTLIVRAHQARDLLHGTATSASPALAGMSRKHLIRMARLSCLAPDIIAAILQGTQPPSVTARQMLRLSDIPLAWPDQRRMLGFG